MKANRVLSSTIFLSLLIVVNGCTQPVYREPATTSESSQPERICFERSRVVDMEFSYPCEERQKAREMALVCDILATSALELVRTNRRIGPTSPKDLFLTAGMGDKETIEVLYENLGEKPAKAYLTMIADMSVNVANRNITDLIAYPEKEFSDCLSLSGYKAERP